MYKKIGVWSVFFAFMLTCSTSVSRAQNVQNFISNEENKIQQDSAVGALNSKQTSALQNRQAQIMLQEQQDKNMNGGNLTQQESRQLAGEEKGLSRGVNGTMSQNNPNAANMNNGWLNRFKGAFNPNNPNFQAQQNWRNTWNQNQVNNVNGQTNNGEPPRHHRQWLNQ
jgi:hypothetical protein